MARTITHQRYIIQPTPHETDGNKWQLHIRISRKDHRGLGTCEFSPQVLCASEQKADIYRIAFWRAHHRREGERHVRHGSEARRAAGDAVRNGNNSVS
ncbi:MAG: hypothetical protein ABIU05_09920 [Nitrospirales bacterium]